MSEQTGEEALIHKPPLDRLAEEAKRLGEITGEQGEEQSSIAYNIEKYLRLMRFEDTAAGARDGLFWQLVNPNILERTGELIADALIDPDGKRTKDEKIRNTTSLLQEVLLVRPQAVRTLLKGLDRAGVTELGGQKTEAVVRMFGGPNMERLADLSKNPKITREQLLADFPNDPMVQIAANRICDEGFPGVGTPQEKGHKPGLRTRFHLGK